jgi:Rieske Fe-S protein
MASGCTVYGADDDPPPANDDDPNPGDADDDGNDEDVVSASTSDVEIGGGVILEDDRVVITQPTEGEFRGFSAVCTHQGCAVNAISDGTINCPCHGSRYSIVDGSVVQAAAGLTPEAQDPLPGVSVQVDGDQVRVIT